MPEPSPPPASVADPYVGPRPFEESDRGCFFGRDREIRQLASLVAARRVVVLYARSGAGKTSLLRAGLIPHLRRHQRLPVLLAPRFGSLAGDSQHRRVWVEALERRLAEPAPASAGAGAPCLLILDQLEEIFGVRHPHARRVELFTELRRHLDERPGLSLLLSLRETWAAALDPYAAFLPDRLRTRFRLERLGAEAARQAVQEPARQAGGELTDEAAAALVDDLRTVHVQDAGGARETLAGAWVEPVQLQVVCRRLWRRSVAAGDRRIDSSDLTAVGSVDSALGDYYDEQVAAVAAATGTGERRLRDWIERSLITDQGLRGQVLRGADATGGLAKQVLANQVLEVLVDARLLRAESRRGAIWYELAHDRLIEPVRASNARWRREHLRPMQHQASLWSQGGRPPGLLLRDRQLADELAWAAAHGDEAVEEEREFLDASRQAWTAVLHERRARRTRWVVVAVVLILAAALVQLRRERERGRRELARGLAAQALSQLDERLDLALLLSLEANRLGVGAAEVRGSLLTSLQYQPRLSRFLHGHQETVWSVAFRPRRDKDDPTQLASGDLRGVIRLWDVDLPPRDGKLLGKHAEGVLSLAFSSDGERMVSTSRDGEVRLWDMTEEPPRGDRLAIDRVVTCAVFDPGDRNRLITGDSANQVRIWDLSRTPPEVRSVGEHHGWVTSVAVHPLDPRLVASGGADHRIRLWRLGTGQVAELSGHDGWVSGLVWSADGEMLASASLDRTVRRWRSRREAGAETFDEIVEPRLDGPGDRLSSLAVSPGGEVLAAAAANGLVYLWDFRTGRSLGPPLTGNLALMPSLAFSPDGRSLAAGNGTAVVLWDVSESREGSGLGRLLDGGAVRRLAFSPDGARLAASAGGETPEIRVFGLAADPPAVERLPGSNAVADAIVFTAAGGEHQVYTVGQSGKETAIRRWQDPWTETPPLWQERSDGIGHHRDLRQVGHPGFLERALEPRRNEPCGAVRTLAAVAGGRVLAADVLGQGVTVRDLADARSVLGRGEVESECPRSLAISPDGATLAAGSDGGDVELLTLPRLDAGRKLAGHVLAVRSLAFSAGGNTLASGSDDGTVRLWDVATATQRRVLAGHTDPVQALAFSPRGDVLASAGRDRTVMLWDAASGVSIGRPLRGHLDPVRSVAFGPDGEVLASGGDDGIRLWELGFEAWRERVCRVANRTLTDEEREVYLGALASRTEPACAAASDP